MTHFFPLFILHYLAIVIAEMLCYKHSYARTRKYTCIHVQHKPIVFHKLLGVPKTLNLDLQLTIFSTLRAYVCTSGTISQTGPSQAAGCYKPRKKYIVA